MSLSKIKKPYIKIYHDQLCDGWYGSYDVSCVVSLWECLPEEDRKKMKIKLFDDIFCVGNISETEMYRVLKIQQGEIVNGKRIYCFENIMIETED